MDDLSAQEALREIDRVDRQVRRTARGVGWMFLIIGVATVPYWLSMLLGPDPLPAIAGPFWIALTISVSLYWYRLRVHERRMKRINAWATVAYVGTTVLTCAVGIYLQLNQQTGPWTPLIVVLSVLAGAPPVLAGVLLLRTP